MKNRDLLVVYNIYGRQSLENLYKKNIESIIWHVKKNNLHDNVRIVISACLKDEETLKFIKDKFGEYVTIFHYDESLPVQVTFNKTVLSSVEIFKEEYEVYLYISGDVYLGKIEDLFPRIIEKNKTGQYGIIHLDVLDIVDLVVRGSRLKVSYDNDKDIALGTWADWIVGTIHKSLKDFYGVPLPDAHGKTHMEVTLSYVCSALRKKYSIMGNSLCFHHGEGGVDSIEPITNSRGEPINRVNRGLLWGRTFEKDILSDIEAIKSGIGYLPGELLTHDIRKYDSEGLSIDENLKHSVKRCFFTNKNDIDYNLIQYEVI